jgi:long-chain fatty acid transport protein
MLTLNINPSIGYKLTEQLSVGLGISLQYIDVQLTQMADLGALGMPPASQMADGKIRLEADDWSWGYNLGLTYQLHEATRIGIAYRSKISHSLEGDEKLWTSNGIELADQNIKADIDLPENLSVAVHHQLNNQWAISADITWTRWSRFETLSVESTGGTFDIDKAENWKNTLRYGLGADYRYNDKWTFRTGIAYDETPIPNEFRTARILGTDRKWVSIGASYTVSDEFIVDGAYTHMFMSDPTINEADSNGYVLAGKYDSGVDMVGLQLRWLMP